MRTVPIALVVAGVLASAAPASAIAVKVSSRDCGTPPIEETVGAEVTIDDQGNVTDPFQPDDQFVDQTIQRLGFCAACLGLTSLNSVEFLFTFSNIEFMPVFEPSTDEDNLWSGLSFNTAPGTAMLTLFPDEGEFPISPNIELPDVRFDFFCDEISEFVLCNPFAAGGNVTIQIAGFSGVTASPVPEPGAMALLGTGLAVLVARRRRRR